MLRAAVAALLASAGALATASAAPPLPPALALTPRCSACLAIAAALHARLVAEPPRNDLDWRGRVGPNGERRGVKLAYAVSEARLDELLDGLCSADGLKGAAWWAKDGDGGSDEGVWVTTTATGSGGSGGAATPPPGWSVPATRAEREARAKQLENACGRLVADWEEDGSLGEALLKKGDAEGHGVDGGSDVGTLLCERLAKECGPGEARAAAAAAEGAGKDEL